MELQKKKKQKKNRKQKKLKDKKVLTPRELKVGEAAGIFFIVIGNGENRLIELVVAKLLKCDGGCDCRKDRDVCGEMRKMIL